MGFDSGSVTFRRFAVVGSQPDQIDQDLLDKLAEHALRPGEVGVPEEVEYGWCGGRHVFDDAFSFDNNVYADALHFALRIDTNKVPGEVRKAYKIIEEDAASKENPSGFISRRQKQIAKETAQQRLEEELRSGKYRRSKILPILWDLPSGTLLCNASNKAQELLLEIFERSFGLSLEPLSAGTLALRLLEDKGRRRDYEDATPTRFVNGPEGESQMPDYPWTAKGPEAKDFLGNEFLLWLWHQAFIHEGAVKTESGDELVVFFDRALDLDCSYGQTGRDSLRGDGVTRMPEALDALRSGKVPRKASLIVESSGSQYTLSLSAESLALGTLKMPKVEEAENPRVLIEERIAMLRDFCKMIESLYAGFLKTRTSSAWEGHTGAIRKWILQSVRTAPAMA